MVYENFYINILSLIGLQFYNLIVILKNLTEC